MSPMVVQLVEDSTVGHGEINVQDMIGDEQVADTNASDLSFVLDNLTGVQDATLEWNKVALDEASPTMAASFSRFLSSNPLQRLTLRSVHVPSDFLSWLPPTLVSLSTEDCWIASRGTTLDPPRTSGALQAVKRLHFDELAGTFNLALLKQASTVTPAIRSVHISLEPNQSEDPDGYNEGIPIHRETLASLPSTVEELSVNIGVANGYWGDPQEAYRGVFAPPFQPDPHPNLSRFDFAITMLDVVDIIPQITETAVHYLGSTRLLHALNTVTLRYYFILAPSFSAGEQFLETFGGKGPEVLFPREVYLAQLDDHLADGEAFPGLREMNVVMSILKFSSSDCSWTYPWPDEGILDAETQAKLKREIGAAFCKTRERVQGAGGAGSANGTGGFNVFLTSGVWHHTERRLTLDMDPGPGYPLGEIEAYGLEG